MSFRLIVIIILLIIWLVTMLLFFLLAYLYHLSHRGYQQKRNQLFNFLQAQTDIELEARKMGKDSPIVFEEDEHLYHIQTGNDYWLSDKSKVINKQIKETLNNCFYLMADFFQIKQTKKFAKYLHLYVSDQRFILENDQEFIVMRYPKIQRIYYSLCKNEFGWNDAMIIITNKKYYQIIVDDPTIFLIVRKIYGQYLG